MNWLLNFEQTIKSNFNLVEGSFQRCREKFGIEWEREFNELGEKCLSKQADIESALAGYVEFIIDSMRLQMKFQEDNTYITKSYLDVAKSVYHNSDYMMKMYLPGILISHFLWTHHFQQDLFFKNNFLNEMRSSNDKRFHDVGIGTGYGSLLALKNVKGSKGQGWDISQSSINSTRSMIEAFSFQDRYKLNKQEVSADHLIEPYPFLISVEVLEHLEQPKVFLKALHSMLLPEGKAFITAAINAPNEDHIYLYRNPQEIINQLEEVGFTVEQYFSSKAYPPRRLVPIVPESGAFIVTRNKI